ncbi:MAG: acylphosphatase [Spirochaetales bacterium]|nr:acylphosphatase [Spirochaetales bacterium]
MKDKSLTIKVYGRVQGVGFRFSAQRAAVSFGVAGWVRNEWDGTVLIHCEGEVSSVDQFVNWCRKGPSLAHVISLDITVLPYQGVHSGFKIDY